TLRRTQMLFANCQNTARLLQREWNVDADRIRVLYPGVDCRHFAPAARDPAVRATLGWDRRRVILTVSRLQKRKGHDCMIAALAFLSPRCPEVLYAIVGA